MNDNIKFYIPDDEVIPTHLRLKVDGIDVFYKQIDSVGYIDYEFRFFPVQTDEEEREKILKYIVGIMENQSYDHGASWRNVFIKRANDTLGIRYIVRFRKRDAG